MFDRFNSRLASFSNVADKVALRVHSSTYDVERRSEIRSFRLSFRRERTQPYACSDEHVSNADILHHVTQLQSDIENDILVSLDWLRVHAESDVAERIIQFDFSTHLIQLLKSPSLSIHSSALECITAYLLPHELQAEALSRGFIFAGILPHLLDKLHSSSTEVASSAFYNLALLDDNTKHTYLSDFTTDSILHMLVEIVNLMPYFYQTTQWNIATSGHQRRPTSSDTMLSQSVEQTQPSPPVLPASGIVVEEPRTPSPEPLIPAPILQASKNYPWILSARSRVQDVFNSMLYFFSTIIPSPRQLPALLFQPTTESPAVDRSPTSSSTSQIMMSASTPSVTETGSMLSPQRWASIRQSLAILCGESICKRATYQLMAVHPDISRIYLYYNLKHKRELLLYQKEQGVREAARMWDVLSPDLDTALQGTIFTTPEGESYDHKLGVLHNILRVLSFFVFSNNPLLNGLDITLLQYIYNTQLFAILLDIATMSFDSSIHQSMMVLLRAFSEQNNPQYIKPLIDNNTLAFLRKILLLSSFTTTVHCTAILYNIACMAQPIFRQTLFDTDIFKILVSMLDYTDDLMNNCRLELWRVTGRSAWESLEESYRSLLHETESEPPERDDLETLPDDVDESTTTLLAASSKHDYTLLHPWQFFFELYPQTTLRRIRSTTIRSEREMLRQGLEAAAILNHLATNSPERCIGMVEYHVMNALCRFGCNFQVAFTCLQRHSILFPFVQLMVRLLVAGNVLAKKKLDKISDTSSESPTVVTTPLELSESEISRVIFMNIPLATLMSNNYYSFIEYLLSHPPYNITVDQNFQTGAVTFYAKPKTKEEHEEQLFSVISCLSLIQHVYIDEYRSRSQDVDEDEEYET